MLACTNSCWLSGHSVDADQNNHLHDQSIQKSLSLDRAVISIMTEAQNCERMHHVAAENVITVHNVRQIFIM